MINLALPSQPISIRIAMNEDVIKAMVRREINGFFDDNAKEYAAVAKLNLQSTDNGWIVFGERGWVIGYNLGENWSESPWFFSLLGPDDPDVYCQSLEACFQMLIYPNGVPTPEAQAKIDANMQARERAKRRGQWRNKQKGKRKRKGPRKNR